MQRPMMPLPTSPAPTPKRRAGKLFAVWAIAIAVIIVDEQISRLLDRVHVNTAILTFLSFIAALVCIAVTMYAFAVVVRWMLRRLFWRVGRRLFLSYVMIGVLPFFLFAILLSAILYLVAGVASQANFRAERQTSIGQLESWATEYGTQGKKPRTEEHLTILDTANDGGEQIPSWLKETNFSGVTLRTADNGVESAQLTVSRQFNEADGVRTIVITEPLDENWARLLDERTGMRVIQRIVTHNTDYEWRGSHRRGNPNDEDEFDNFGRRISLSRVFTLQTIVFFDITEEGGIMDWQSGATRRKARIFTLIANPTPNLLHFYFGGSSSSSIMRGIFGLIVSLATMLMIIYFFASAFAAVLIFSISRAVNRIEKGTKAVERGDFSYRIRMTPHNQLGQMAQSFDRMTESIASLLTSVAEKERLQSEIEIAASIQRNLLPNEGPRFGGVSFAAHFEPTASIGGDYYDVFNIDKTRLAVAIGDVSGHGLSTGLVMAMVKAAITTLVEEGADETSLFHRLNDLVYRSTERRAFMTLAFTIFDLEHGRIRHTNAGHLYPYLLRSGGPPIAIEVPSLPLGVRSDILTHTAEVDLNEGDTVVDRKSVV